jgi:hypothetical protein
LKDKTKIIFFGDSGHFKLFALLRFLFSKTIKMETKNTSFGMWGSLGIWADENRFGVISIALLIVGCLGGVTMNLGAVKETWSMIVVIIPTMLTLSLLLAVSPMKWILNALALSVIVDLLVLLII